MKFKPGMLEDFWGDMDGDGHGDDFIGLTEGAATLGGGRENTPVASGSGSAAAGPSKKNTDLKKGGPKKTGLTLKKQALADPFISDSDSDSVEVITDDTKGKGRASPTSTFATAMPKISPFAAFWRSW